MYMNCSIEMYQIRNTDVKIKVPCESCYIKGIVDKRCNKCGGNGTHNKTIRVWKVMPRTVRVEKIDRSNEDSFYCGVQTGYVGGLRYWTGASEYFNEENKLLHFSSKDAQAECDRRNSEVASILNINNYNMVHDIKKQREQEDWLNNL